MNRRQLLQLAAATPVLLPGFSRAEPSLPALVELIEQAPRDQLTAKVLGLIRQGLGRQQLLWAIQLAGMRQIQPRPVGFKFHAVMMVDSARRLAASGGGIEGWVPILWNLDYFKFSQQRNLQQGGWQLQPFDDRVPTPERSLELLHNGLLARDELAVDAAAVAVARQHGLNRVFEVLAHFSVRDFHSIGHKAIYLCHSWRLFQLNGDEQAETVIRALAYALIADGNVSPQDAHWTRDDYRRNLERARRIPLAAMRTGSDAEVTSQLVDLLATGSADECCEAVVDMLQKTPVQAVWDGIFLAAAERVYQQPNIPMLHCVTVSHAIGWLWRQSADQSNRNLMLLQAVAYLARMREQRWSASTSSRRLAELNPSSEALDLMQRRAAIFDGRSRGLNAGQLMAYPFLSKRSTLEAELATLLRRKSVQAHDFKFGASVLETLDWLSPPYRLRYLAGASVRLPTAAMPDSDEAAGIKDWLTG